MPMIVANNLNALSAQNTLNANNSRMSGSLERLSTGYKINSGKDDPSGLVISEQLRAQNVGLERAVQNTQEANNVLGIAEGALNEMNNILSKMRQLAVHSANNGVTSPEQVAADQAEVDSSIQTLDRIARTTKFSDQFLLNGNKELQYDSSVMVTDSFDMKLVNENLSDVRQIFKRDDFKLNISFSGKSQNAADEDIDNGNEAQKGYFEVSKNESAATQVVTGNTDKTKNYTLTADQAFTLGGDKGSRYLSFAKGTHLGEMVTSINSVKDSTGVEATLIYDSNAEAVNAGAGTQEITNTVAHTSGGADVFSRTSLGEITTVGIEAVSITTAGAGNLKAGKNIDGYGRAYLKMIDDDTFEIYKDSAMTMKVAEGDVDGSGDTQVMAVNNSDFTGIDLTFSSGLSAGMTSTLQLGYMQEDTSLSALTTETVDFYDLALASSTAGSATGDTHFTNTGSYLSGIKLGENTDETGKLYIKATLKDVTGGDSDQSQIFVYKDARMRDEDLVAMSDKTDLTTNSSGGVAMRLYAADAGGNGGTSGLYGTLNFDMSDANQDLTFETSISSDNLALRISAEDYGSNSKVTLDQHEGAIFSRYSETDGAVLIDAGLDGESWTEYGRDATVSLNGQELKLDGIEGTITNLDTTATIVFNEGGLGTTTLAAVGYNEGAIGSKAAEMYNDEDNYVTHALHGTTETLGDWEGGMQFQLGEGSGDQERTVLSIKDMTATNLGKVKFTGSFETDLESEKYLSINDMLSGGWASLAADPVKSLEIIDQAIEDVSELRANIGAFQANMLETNANSLTVAIENITKTESYIRDADMAKESTEFSKNQILVQAGTSMLAQANQLSQGALSLIG